MDTLASPRLGRTLATQKALFSAVGVERTSQSCTRSRRVRRCRPFRTIRSFAVRLLRDPDSEAVRHIPDDWLADSPRSPRRTQGDIALMFKKVSTNLSEWARLRKVLNGRPSREPARRPAGAARQMVCNRYSRRYLQGLARRASYSGPSATGYPG